MSTALHQPLQHTPLRSDSHTHTTSTTTTQAIVITIQTPDESHIELNEDNNIVVLGRGQYGIPRNDNKLSRHHATILYEADKNQLIIQAHSLNPLYIGTDSTTRPKKLIEKQCVLHHGNVIYLLKHAGELKYKFTIEWPTETAQQSLVNDVNMNDNVNDTTNANGDVERAQQHHHAGDVMKNTSDIEMGVTEDISESKEHHEGGDHALKRRTSSSLRRRSIRKPEFQREVSDAEVISKSGNSQATDGGVQQYERDESTKTLHQTTSNISAKTDDDATAADVGIIFISQPSAPPVSHVTTDRHLLTEAITTTDDNDDELQILHHRKKLPTFTAVKVKTEPIPSNESNFLNANAAKQRNLQGNKSKRTSTSTSTTTTRSISSKRKGISEVLSRPTATRISTKLSKTAADTHHRGDTQFKGLSFYFIEGNIGTVQCRVLKQRVREHDGNVLQSLAASHRVVAGSSDSETDGTSSTNKHEVVIIAAPIPNAAVESVIAAINKQQQQSSLPSMSSAAASRAKPIKRLKHNWHLQQLQWLTESLKLERVLPFTSYPLLPPEERVASAVTNVPRDGVTAVSTLKQEPAAGPSAAEAQTPFNAVDEKVDYNVLQSQDDIDWIQYIQRQPQVIKRLKADAALQRLAAEQKLGSDASASDQTEEDGDGDTAVCDEDPNNATSKSLTKQWTASEISEHNGKIADALNKFAELYQLPGEQYRQYVFRRASKIVRRVTFPILSGKDAMSLKGIGESIGLEIDNIIRNMPSQRALNLMDDDRANVIRLLQTVHGIGNATASKLYNNGIRSIEDLKANEEWLQLKRDQRVFLKYYDQMVTKMTRAEVEAAHDIVREMMDQIDPRIQITICGSYRRGADRVGDVDLICAHPSPGTFDIDRKITFRDPRKSPTAAPLVSPRRGGVSAIKMEPLRIDDDAHDDNVDGRKKSGDAEAEDENRPTDSFVTDDNANQSKRKSEYLRRDDQRYLNMSFRRMLVEEIVHRLKRTRPPFITDDLSLPQEAAPFKRKNVIVYDNIMSMSEHEAYLGVMQLPPHITLGDADQHERERARDSKRRKIEAEFVKSEEQSSCNATNTPVATRASTSTSAPTRHAPLNAAVAANQARIAELMGNDTDEDDDEEKDELNVHKINPHFHRRIDIMFYDSRAYPMAVLGWTGASEFNRAIRAYADKKFGLLLSDHSITPFRRVAKGKLGIGCPILVQCESDIFHNLGLPYTIPMHTDSVPQWLLNWSWEEEDFVL